MLDRSQQLEGYRKISVHYEPAWSTIVSVLLASANATAIGVAALLIYRSLLDLPTLL